jgi:hypothetical protein
MNCVQEGGLEIDCRTVRWPGFRFERGFPLAAADPIERISVTDKRERKSLGDVQLEQIAAHACAKAVG